MVSMVVRPGRSCLMGRYYSGGFGGLTALIGSTAGGGGADFIIDFPVTVTPGITHIITIGEGGVGEGCNGGPGILTV